MQDREIVALFSRREETAIAEAQEKYAAYCLTIARNILGSPEDAEECVNEALHAAWNSIPPRQPENLKTYLGKLTREISLSRWRREHAGKRFPGEPPLPLDEIAEVATDDSFSPDTDEKELSAAISDFLRTLPATERNLFLRRYWYNDSVADICRRFGFGESKVKMTLKRTRDKLAKKLKKEGFIL